MPTAIKKITREELLSQLARIEKDTDRRKFLTRHKTLIRSEVVKQLADLVLEKIRVDTKEALHLAEAAVLIGRKLRRKEDIALGTRAKANALYACGDNRAAVEHHEQAIEMYEALGNLKEAARTLSSSIQPLILLGEYDRAFKSSEKAREIFIRIGETRRIATLDNNVGNIFHRQDRFEEAMLHYETRLQHSLTITGLGARGHHASQHGHVPHQPERFLPIPRLLPEMPANSASATTCLSFATRPTTTSPTSTISAANTVAPSKCSSPRAAPAK